MKAKLLRKIRRKYSFGWSGSELRMYRINRKGVFMYFNTVQEFVYWYVGEKIGYVSLCDYMVKMMKRGRKKELVV